jgi:hypothetical protein
MLRPRKDQLFLYEKFAVASQAYAPPSAAAAKKQARFEVQEPARPAPPSSKTVREAISPGASELASMVVAESSKLVHGQQNLIQELVTTCEKLQREVDYWKNKAEFSHLPRGTGSSAAQEGARIDAIRKLLARELHPEAANVSSEEAALRNSLFKTIWPKIDQIVKGRVTN